MTSLDQGKEAPSQRGPCFSREEIKVAWWRARGRGSARIRNRGEWLLRVCSRLEEGVARREGKRLLRMRTNDPSTRPYSSWEPSQSFVSTRAYRESNCDPSRPTRELGRGKEKKTDIRISSSFLLAILYAWSRRFAVGKHFGYSRKIYNNHSARRTTNIQQRINRWSSAGFFSPPPSSPFSSRVSRYPTDLSRFWKSCNEFDRARSVLGSDIFIQGWFFSLHLYARMIILTR